MKRPLYQSMAVREKLLRHISQILSLHSYLYLIKDFLKVLSGSIHLTSLISNNWWTQACQVLICSKPTKLYLHFPVVFIKLIPSPVTNTIVHLFVISWIVHETKARDAHIKLGNRRKPCGFSTQRKQSNSWSTQFDYYNLSSAESIWDP